MGTRSLSITTTNVLSANSSATANTTASGSDTNSTTVYLLFYENPPGEASALLQRVPSTDSPKATQWVGTTSTLHESVANAKFNAPFASRANFDAHSIAPTGPPPSGFCFYSRLNASAGTVYNINITIGPSGPATFGADYGKHCALSYPEWLLLSSHLWPLFSSRIVER